MCLTADIVLVLALLGGVILMRYLAGAGEVVNDGYILHLSALHILQGEYPGRDYVAIPYEMLGYWTAALLFLGKLSLSVDFFASAALMGLGVVAVYLATRLLGLTHILAIYPPLLVIALYPRLYNYFKIAALGALVLAVAFYARAPSGRRAVLLGCAAGFCLIARLDLGLLAAFLAGLVILLSGQFAVRRLLTHTACFAAPLLPVALLCLALQPLNFSTAASIPYGDKGGESGTVLSAPLRQLAQAIFPFTLDIPPLANPSPRRFTIHIHYADGTSTAQRETFEATHRLDRPRKIQTDGDVWEYSIAWYERSGLQAIVQSKLVADTRYIDRTNFTLQERPYVTHLLRNALNDGLLVGLLLAVLYAGLAAAIILVLAPALVSWRGGVPPFEGRLQAYGRTLLAFVWATFFGMQLLVRGNWADRLPDVSPLLAVAVALTIHLGLRAARRPIQRRIAIAACHGILIVIVIGAAGYGLRHGNRLEDILVNATARPLPHTLVRNARAIREFRSGFAATLTSPRNQRQQLAKYLSLCTTPDARLIQTFFMPEIPFWAGRLMAGGRIMFHAPWGPLGLSEADSIKKLAGQNVPLVVSTVESWPQFRKAFPVTTGYIDRHYRLAVTSTFGGRGDFRFMIFLRNDLASSATVPGDGTPLPCPSASGPVRSGIGS